ncbi:flagellar biosynthesis anti-sigma factor FlgM [Planococcus lenghuensis]|uniref:Negative regulator of flagellin synthesis n=1 Tax=Planococcus lenghuensis TaxID=2213202 RepID=A0A1Q2L2M7_9BACL|nr:flagellar biosynthesis anti-sigma factor FlgM [Planococcus lenghuensis]AQQ54142.1 flagellar biosynthesis anti-sigma factor FlgM [Planococcus lenghuensis]
MNIDKTNGSAFVQSYHKQTQVTPVAKSNPLQREDQLQISDKAKELFEKKDDIDAERQDKIQELKARIQSGEYEVSNEKLAGKFYDFWFDK